MKILVCDDIKECKTFQQGCCDGHLQDFCLAMYEIEEQEKLERQIISDYMKQPNTKAIYKSINEGFVL